MVVTLALCLAGTATQPSGLTAQRGAWRMTGGASQVWFGGGVTDTTGGNLDFRPTATVAWALGADHAVGGVRLGLGLSYLSSDLEASGSGVRITSTDTHLRQYELAALVSVPLLRVGQSGAELSVSAGPTVEIWTATGSDNRTRAGGLAALQLSAPITPDWALLATAAGSLASSPFEDKDLPDGFERAALRSGRIGIGLHYGF
jgi:hypothetical protein